MEQQPKRPSLREVEEAFEHADLVLWAPTYEVLAERDPDPRVAAINVVVLGYLPDAPECGD
jgi:hypothetical protein